VEAVDNPGTSPNNFFRVSIAGASQAMTRISVDGATINDRVTGGTAQNFSQETVQEFQISTFNFDPSTSVTGVGSVNVVSRSGSNDFHGSAFFYFRDHNLSAYPSLKRDPRRLVDPSREDPFFARRQGGGSIGGPVKPAPRQAGQPQIRLQVQREAQRLPALFDRQQRQLQHGERHLPAVELGGHEKRLDPGFGRHHLGLHAADRQRLP